MRMFVALALPTDIVADLERFLEPRWDVDSPWRWVPPANWHVTLAFVGDVAPDQLERLADGLRAAALRTEPFEARLVGAGAFPELTRAKHLYQAVSEPTGALASLALHVRNAAQQAGLVVDGKRYVPHLSVARQARPADATHWLRVLDTYESAPWRVGEMHLYRSELGLGANGHSRYGVEQTFALGTGEQTGF